MKLAKIIEVETTTEERALAFVVLAAIAAELNASGDPDRVASGRELATVLGEALARARAELAKGGRA